MRKNVKKPRTLQSNSILILSDMKLLITTLCVVMIWRGFWNFLDHYFFEGYFVLSNSLSIILGIIIITVLNISNNIKKI